MGEFLLESQFFGLFLSLAFFQLARWLNRKAGREVISPLLFATLLCIAVLLVFDIDFEVYNRGAQYLDVLLTPATICLAIPLYRQYELLRRNAVAVLAGSVAGVAAHMAGCLLMLAVFLAGLFLAPAMTYYLIFALIAWAFILVVYYTVQLL